MFWLLIKQPHDRCINCYHRRDAHGDDGYCDIIVTVEPHVNLTGDMIDWDEPCFCPGFRKDWEA